MINRENIIKQNIINFINYGGKTMYSYKFSDKDVDLDKSSEKEKVFEKLKEVDNKYTYATTPKVSDDEPKFEKKSYKAPTDDEIEQMAKDSLESYKDGSLSKIDDEFSKKFGNLDEKTEKLIDENEKDNSEIFSNAKSAERNATNSAIKNGVLRSSIYEQVMKEIDDDKERKLSENEQRFSTDIKKLESERSILESQKESALASFDISYALKLNEEINKINSNIAKKQDEVLKYNNQIEKQMSEYKFKKEQELARQNESLTKLLSEKGLVEVNKMKQKEKYDIIKDYLNSMSKKQALSELEDEKFQKELANYYPALFAEIYSKDE